MPIAKKPTLVSNKTIAKTAKDKAADTFAANNERVQIMLRFEASLLPQIDALAKEYAAEHGFRVDRNAWIVKTLREAVERGGLAMERGKK